MTLTRRGFLGATATGCLAGIAGCFEHPSEKRCMYLIHLPEPDVRILDAPTVQGIEPRSPTSGVFIDGDRLAAEAHRVAEQAIADDSTVTYGYRPVEHGTHVAKEGVYYVIDHRETGTEEVERWTLSSEQVDDPAEEPVHLRDIPADKRDVLRMATETRVVFREVNPDPTELDLAPEPDPAYIYAIPEPDDDPTPLRLVASREMVEEAEYTFEAVRLTTDRSGFVDDTIMEADELDLSGDEEAILERATDGVYDPEENGDDEAYRSLQEGIDMTYLRYTGEVYRTNFTWIEGGLDCPADPPE